MDSNKNILSIRIKKLRTDLGLTQEELALKLGLKGKSSIANYESGKISPSDEIKIKLCEVFDCSMDYLMGVSEYKNTWEEYDATHDIEKIKQDVKKTEHDQIKEDFEFAYHKEAEGLTDEEIADAIRFYKQIKYGKKDNNN